MINKHKTLLKAAYLKTRSAVLRPMLLLRRVKKLPKVGIRSILFLRHDRIGDMVLSTPALKALKRAYPGAHITILASQRNHEIITHDPHVDEILVYRGLYRFLKEMYRRGRIFDLAIDPFNTYELKQAFLAYISRARYRIGFEEAGREIFFNLKAPSLSPVKHLVDHLLELIGYLGVDVSGCEPELFLTEPEISWASEVLSAKGIDKDTITISIHPGAYYKSNMWPSDRFGLLAKRIAHELQAQVIVFVGHGEDAIVANIKQIGSNEVHIISKLSIRQFMAILSRCNLFIGNNSGPLHIAAALGLPTVSTIGPPVIPLWLPYGKNHIVLRKNLDCQPCNRAVCEEHTCMKLISVDEVFEAVQSQISRMRSKQKRGVTARGRVKNS